MEAAAARVRGVLRPCRARSRALAVLLATLGIGASANAQVQPNAPWRTIESEHFRVTFTPELELLARRTISRAEEAWRELARTLRPPRGKVDIVVSDNYDIANGYATAFPTNRIVLYANPPITSGSLRFVDDPTDQVVTHELAHIFQLDRARGIWGLAQKVFGRSPYLFPNAFQPSWLLEGFAVHHETRLTGSGRLAGTDHRMIARTAAMSHAVPRLDQLSLASPRFPFAYSTYAYGSLFVEHLGNTFGDSALTRYVEASSANLVPMWLDWPARRAFGRSLTRAYAEWSRAIVDSAPPSASPMPGWRDLTVQGAYANFPRWLNDSTLVYAGTPGRETYGLYGLTLHDGGRVERRRLARRHTASPSSIRGDGALVYSQLEYDGPYQLRSDIYLDLPRGGSRRLTRNARLSLPDVRPDGRIVAVQTVPGGTRLALVSHDGRDVRVITTGGLDEHWIEPRWSPDGARIAAIRWTTGGRSQLVVLDTTGRELAAPFGARAIVATPSWSRDGRHVYFSSDHRGTANLFRVAPEGGALERVSDARTGLFEPEPAPTDSILAAVIFRADGYHIGVAPLDIQGPDSVAAAPLAFVPFAPVTTTPARRYSPWRSLLPRYWLPFFESALEEGHARLGAYTSGSDLVGRHGYQAMLFVPTDNSGLTGSFSYRNASLGQPVLELSAAQDWETMSGIFDQGQQVGNLRRRTRDATLSVLLQRPRARTFSYVSAGGGIEVRDYASFPASLLPDLDPVFGGVYQYPRVVLSSGWSNTQYPPLAISPEDGVSLAATARWRWRTGDTVQYSASFVGTAAGFKSIPLPGFAHHVAALRLAGGHADNRGNTYLEVGGVSGGTLDVLPGYSVGEGRRTFGVRGYPAGSLVGIRALGASLEYRAPLLLPGRGLGTLPLFLDRTSLTLFADAGSAWCPSIQPTRTIPNSSLCTQEHFDFGRTVSVGREPFLYLEPEVLASAGAELNVNAAILSWDAPFRYRVGIALPFHGGSVTGSRKVQGYFAVGAAF